MAGLDNWMNRTGAKEREFGIIPDNWVTHRANPQSAINLRGFEEEEPVSSNCMLRVLEWMGVYKEGESITVAKIIVLNHESSAYLKYNLLNTLACLLSSWMYVYMAAFRINPKAGEEQNPAEITMFWAAIIFELNFAFHCGI